VVSYKAQTSSGKARSKCCICCFFAKHAALRRKSKNWLAQNQNNVSKWSGTKEMSRTSETRYHRRTNNWQGHTRTQKNTYMNNTDSIKTWIESWWTGSVSIPYTWNPRCTSLDWCGAWNPRCTNVDWCGAWNPRCTNVDEGFTHHINLHWYIKGFTHHINLGSDL
jgi:hypothetical protein